MNFRAWMMHASKTSQFKVKAIFNNLIPITLSEKEMITSSIEPPSPIQHLRRGAPFFNLPRGAKTPSSVCTPGVCHPGYATEYLSVFFVERYIFKCQLLSLIIILAPNIQNRALRSFLQYSH